MATSERKSTERMTADAFLAWADARPEGRFELTDGRIVAMAPERGAHVRAKLAAVNALAVGLAARDLPCEALIDGMGVRIDDATVFVPDVIVSCGPRTPDDAMEVSDPVVLVEVVSPSSATIDSGAKLSGYFRLPTLRHYLVVDTSARAITHHRRDEEGEIATRILREGTLILDPPNFEVEVASFFASL